MYFAEERLCGVVALQGNRYRQARSEALSIPPRQNHLLAAFSPDDCQAVMAGGRVVSLKQGQCLYRQNARIDYVYFPLNCVVSVIVGAKDREQIEMASIGNEGMA